MRLARSLNESSIVATLRALVAVLTFCTAGCSHYKEGITGPYQLRAKDSDDDMSICYRSGDTCFERVGKTVFAVGFDATYITAARHPWGDRSRVEYFYIVIAEDNPTVEHSPAVRGPFTPEAYKAERVQLPLPELSRELTNLK
jgi:hypothetical protein